MTESLRVKRVALYIRVSSLEQKVHGHSLQMQKDELVKWAKENDCIIYDTYIDDGYSATTLKRPEFQRMIDESANFDMIIFIKLDRFSRGVANYYKTMEKLEKTNTHWKAIFEEFDTTTAQGRLMINLYLSIAEQEAALAGERTKAVFKNRLENGEVILSNLPRGYHRVKEGDKSVVRVKQDEAEYIRAAFKHFRQYGSLRKTQHYIQEEYNVPLPRGTFNHMMKNKIYIGTYEHEEFGEFKNIVDPIVTEKEFYDVQNLISKNAKQYKSTEKLHSYIFTGMCYCRFCGRKLGGKRTTYGRTAVKKHGKIYRCSKQFNDNACENNYPMPEKFIEKFLLENVRHLLQDRIITYNIEKQKEKETPAAKLRKKVTQLEKKMSKLKDLYLDDMIQKEEYELDYKRFSREVEELKTEIESCETASKHFNIDLYKSFLEQDFEEQYHTLSSDEKRRLWLSVVDRINISKGVIEPVFF